jgi:probable phosphoglycerate mutase
LMALRIFLIRHGQTDENARGVLQGHSDTRLNALGRRQAEALASRLNRFAPRIETLVASDLARAAETAAAVERALGLRAGLDAAWRERAFGSFEGRTLDDAHIWRAAAGTDELPGAETGAAFEARIGKALLGLAGAHRDSRSVAVVTHGGPIRTVLRLLGQGSLRLAEGARTPEVVPIANCSIVQMRASWPDAAAPAWSVDRVNDTEHLSVELQAASRSTGQE